MNLSGTLNAVRAIIRPQLLHPKVTVSTFDEAPALFDAGTRELGSVQAVVLDKDNCFAIDGELDVYKPYQSAFERLRQHYPAPRLLIVSNSAGTDSDVRHEDATRLELNTGVPVLRHSTKKPGCGQDVFRYFVSRPASKVNRPSDVVVIGDRLFTDVLMANSMGFKSIWVEQGIVPSKTLMARFEKQLLEYSKS